MLVVIFIQALVEWDVAFQMEKRQLTGNMKRSLQIHKYDEDTGWGSTLSLPA